MHANISARVSREYIYQMDAVGTVKIQAGPGSAQTFRYNFYLRLAEVFYNLEWLLNNQPEQFSREEFEVYASLYRSIADMRQDLPMVLNNSFERLQNRIGINAEDNHTALQGTTIELDVPSDLDRLTLPEGVNQRLQYLLDLQDQGRTLTPEERKEAEGLVTLAETLSLIKLRAQRVARDKAP